jgi:hypothetical protein
VGVSEGLGEEVHRPAAERAERAVQGGGAGDHDGAGAGLVLAEGGQQARAVPVGKVHVGDEQLDRLGGEDLLRLGDAGGGDDLAAHPAADDVADHLDEGRLVVHHQDPRLRRRRLLLLHFPRRRHSLSSP